MKKMLVVVMALGLNVAFASSNREVICSIPFKVESNFFLTTSSSCPDYVERSKDVFIANPDACLDVITNHKLSFKKISLKKKTIHLATAKKLMCFVGLSNGKSFVVGDIRESKALNVVEY